MLPNFGNRIILRRLALVDLPAFQSYRHDPEVGRYQGWQPIPDEEASQFLSEMSTAELFLTGHWTQIGIADRTNQLIGDIGIFINGGSVSAEIGFTLNRSYQGLGLAAEAVREAIRLIFRSTPVEKVLAVTDARNRACIRLLERLKMTKTKTVEAMFRGEPCQEHHYELLRPQ